MKYKRPWLANYQRRFIDDTARIIVIDAATKTGKTVSLIVWLFEQALQGKPGSNYWWIAPTYAQAKIAFRRLRRFISSPDFITSNHSDLTIKLATGAMIEFKSGEKPDNLYGEDVHAAVIDEGSRVRHESYVAIRTTLTATRGPLRIIGNVKGTENWVFKLGQQIKKGEIENTSYYVFTYQDAIDAGIGSANEMEEARAMLPLDWFMELYFCVPRIAGEKPWAYKFDREKHCTTGLKFNPVYPVYLSFDFNVDPITAIAEQHGVRDGKPWIHYFQEFRINDSDTEELCKQIATHFHGLNPRYTITGDASGTARSSLKKGLTHYKTIQRVLRVAKTQIKGVWGANPALTDSREVSNGILQNHPEILFDAENCPYLIADLEQCQAKPDDTIDKGADFRQSHLLDAWRYDIWHFHRKWFMRRR